MTASSFVEAAAATSAQGPAAFLSEDEKLDAALQALGEDIIAKSKQIKNEETWVTEVKKIVTLYTKKLTHVVNNVKNLRGEVRKLYIKKRQIQNLKIQTALSARMKEAEADLKNLDSKLSLVKSRANDFARTRGGITKTINMLKSKLNELKGVPKAKKATKKAKKSKKATKKAAKKGGKKASKKPACKKGMKGCKACKKGSKGCRTGFKRV